MTNTIAAWLGALIFLGFAADWWFQDWQATLFLGFKMTELIEWLAFWR